MEGQKTTSVSGFVVGIHHEVSISFLTDCEFQEGKLAVFLHFDCELNTWVLLVEMMQKLLNDVLSHDREIIVNIPKPNFRLFLHVRLSENGPFKL